MTDNETDRLNNVANWYETEGFYEKILQRGYEKIQIYFEGDRCLELGCADGAMTEHLVNDFEFVVAVDGAQKYCEEVRNRLDSDHLTVKCSLFEDYQPKKCFDTIIMTHALEHVREPVKLLERVKSWLRKDGRLIIVVPNGNSLHRQVGSQMGLIETPDTIDKHDEELGHRRVYLPSQLDKHVQNAGLSVHYHGGIALKPLTNNQMTQLDEDVQNAYLKMGDLYPIMSAERYVVVS